MINEFKGTYWFLSNFYPAQVTYEGLLYPTLEHAYQAAKTDDIEQRLSFKKPGVTAGIAKNMGRALPLPDDWDERKDNVMLLLLYSKFSNPELKRKLLDTGYEELVEGNWWGDKYWGVSNGEGQNKLGKMLMHVRHDLGRQNGIPRHTRTAQ